MDEDVDSCPGERVAECAGITAGEDRLLPGLRVAEEELGDCGLAGSRLGERVGLVDMCSDAHHPPSLKQGQDQPLRTH
jgi:hypothetical protein